MSFESGKWGRVGRLLNVDTGSGAANSVGEGGMAGVETQDMGGWKRRFDANASTVVRADEAGSGRSSSSTPLPSGASESALPAARFRERPNLLLLVHRHVPLDFWHLVHFLIASPTSGPSPSRHLSFEERHARQDLAGLLRGPPSGMALVIGESYEATKLGMVAREQGQLWVLSAGDFWRASERGTSSPRSTNFTKRRPTFAENGS